ncbi:MAG TPA: hypothetical protein VJ085_01265 [Candidatus Acidoferrales bacterium]|nr:hypothetical protein [Candidatus Acidoferrales bacterium]
MGEAETATPGTPGPKMKVRRPRQRACDEKDGKGKLCAGHIKRYYDYPKELEAILGKGREVYRCHRCQTLYLPRPEELPRSLVLRY